MTSLEKVLDSYQNAQGDPLKSVLKGDVYQKMYESASESAKGDLEIEKDSNE